MSTHSRPPADSPELEALFQAARQAESTLLRERNQIARLQADLDSQRERHARDIEQARAHLKQWAARDEEQRQQLTDTRTRLQAYVAHAERLQQVNARLTAEAREFERRGQLDLVAARTSCQHLQQKVHELEQAQQQIKPELERAKAELERIQTDALEREHRYQASILSYQGRDRVQHEALQATKDHLKQTQQELAQHKSRWLDSERLRQEAEHALRRQSAIEHDAQKTRELEESNHSLRDKLMIEKRRREQAESAAATARREVEQLEARLQEAQERLGWTEEQLAKTSAESALLKATRKATARASAPAPAPARERETELRHVDLELLEKFALPGHPVIDQ